MCVCVCVCGEEREGDGMGYRMYSGVNMVGVCGEGGVDGCKGVG